MTRTAGPGAIAPPAKPAPTPKPASTPRPGGPKPTATPTSTAPAGRTYSQDQIRQIITQAWTAAGLPPELGILVAQRESGLNPNASGDGGHSIGLFQENDAGRGAGLSVAQRQDPVANAQRAAAEFARYKAQYQNDWGAWAAAAQRPANAQAYASGINYAAGRGGAQLVSAQQPGQVKGGPMSADPEHRPAYQDPSGAPSIAPGGYTGDGTLPTGTLSTDQTATIAQFLGLPPGLDATTLEIILSQNGYGEREKYLINQIIAASDQMKAQAAMLDAESLAAYRAGDLALAQQKEVDSQQMAYAAEMMKMGQNPRDIFKYQFARYGLQPPAGQFGGIAPLPVPDVVKSQLMQQPNAPTNPAAGLQGSTIPAAYNPQLSSIIPGATQGPGSFAGAWPGASGQGAGFQPGPAGAPPSPAGPPPAFPPTTLPSQFPQPTSAPGGGYPAGKPADNTYGGYFPAGALPLLSQTGGTAAKGGPMNLGERPQATGPVQRAPVTSPGALGVGPPSAASQLMPQLNPNTFQDGQRQLPSLPFSPSDYANSQPANINPRMLTGAWQGGVGGGQGYTPPAGGASPPPAPPAGGVGGGFSGLPMVSGQGLVTPPQNIMPGSTLGGGQGNYNVTPAGGAQGGGAVSGMGSPPPSAGGGGAPGGGAGGQVPGLPPGYGGSYMALPPFLQNLSAQMGRPEAAIPTQQTQGYTPLDFGVPSTQSMRYWTPDQTEQFLGYQRDVAGVTPSTYEGTGNAIEKLAPQGAGLSAPTTFDDTGQNNSTAAGFATGGIAFQPGKYPLAEQGVPEQITPRPDLMGPGQQGMPNIHGFGGLTPPQLPPLQQLLGGLGGPPQGAPGGFPGSQPSALPALPRPIQPTSREMGMFSTEPITPIADVPMNKLGFSDRGPNVVKLQRALEQAGFLTFPPNMSPGYYGPLTNEAVVKFQRQAGVSVPDGGWDKQSGKLLKDMIENAGGKGTAQGPNPYSFNTPDTIGAAAG